MSNEYLRSQARVVHAARELAAQLTPACVGGGRMGEVLLKLQKALAEDDAIFTALYGDEARGCGRIVVTDGQYKGREGRLVPADEVLGGFKLPVPAEQAAWVVVWLDGMAGPVRVPAVASARPAAVDPELTLVRY